MKKTLALLFSIVALQLSAQNFAPIDKSIMDIVYFPQGAHRVYMAKTAEDKAKIMPKIKIIYSRPLLNGRKAFGELVKFDQSWRLGANESTEITFYQAVKIGDTVLAPGSYTLYCTPSATSWKLRVHPNLEGWGIFGFDETKDIASITANTTNTDTKIEAFSIAMYEASPKVVHIKVGWENTIVEFPVQLL
jgi:hypothetical protein